MMSHRHRIMSIVPLGIGYVRSMTKDEVRAELMAPEDEPPTLGTPTGPEIINKAPVEKAGGRAAQRRLRQLRRNQA